MSSTVSMETVEAANVLIQHARAMGVAWLQFGELKVQFHGALETQGTATSRNPFTPDIAPGALAQNSNPLEFDMDSPDAYFSVRAALANAVAGSAQRDK